MRLRVKRQGDGQWGIRTDDDKPLLSGKTFSTPALALTAAQELLRALQ
jgi:hypothetical protein